MILQLREVFQIEGLKKPVEFEITLEELAGVHGYRFAEPVKVSGDVSNRAGIVTLKYSVSCVLDVECDRCLKPFKQEHTYDFSHTVVPTLHSDNSAYDSYIAAENDSIDMNETALTDLLLMLPTKILCSEDCKGLCFICGCDLNESTCDCLK
ncbi:MAG: YceD family protein [Ruminococcus sp.]